MTPHDNVSRDHSDKSILCRGRLDKEEVHLGYTHETKIEITANRLIHDFTSCGKTKRCQLSLVDTVIRCLSKSNYRTVRTMEPLTTLVSYGSMHLYFLDQDNLVSEHGW